MKCLSYVVAWGAVLYTTAATSPTSTIDVINSVAQPVHSMVRKETVMPHKHDGEHMTVEVTGVAALLKQERQPSGNETAVTPAAGDVTAATPAAGNATSPDVAAGLVNDTAIAITATEGSVVTAESPTSVDPVAGLAADDVTEKKIFAKAEIAALNTSEAAKSDEEKANEEVLTDDIKKEVAGEPVPVVRTADPSDSMEVQQKMAGEPIPMHLERPDLTYDYVDVSLLGTCDSHYEFQGTISNDDCAQRCFETHGCTRFTNGGCSLGCRVSAAGKNVRNGVDVPLDGQCTIASGDASSGCIVYELAFFNAVKQPSSCGADFKLITSATTKAECAHACKNTAGCTTFSAEPNCMGGCRISEPTANANRQCALATDTGCTEYSVFR